MCFVTNSNFESATVDGRLVEMDVNIIRDPCLQINISEDGIWSRKNLTLSIIFQTKDINKS